MTDIVEFLEARLSEDEASALATTEYQPIDEWDAVGVEDGDNPEIARSCWTVVEIAMPRRTNQSARSLMTHIARHDPARALREVAAKRELLDLHFDGNPGDYEPHYCETCHDYSSHSPEAWPCESVRALASVYADHPDYQPVW